MKERVKRLLVLMSSFPLLHFLSYTFQMWKGKWNDIHIVGKKLAMKIVNKRISRDFSEEYSKLRFVLLYF